MASSSSTDAETAAREGYLGRPDCPLCQGMGYLHSDVPVGHPDFGKLLPCPCRLSEIQAKRADSFRSMADMGALDRYTFDSFHPEGHGLTPDRQENLRRAFQIAREYARQPRGWLLLLGSFGCGKTHLAAAIANEALAQGTLPIFVTVPDLLDHLRAAFAPTSTEAYSERFEQVRRAPLLILDDLGTEHATPWAAEKLFQLLNYRYMMRLPTVITSNQMLEQMEPRLRSRMADPEFVEIVTILAPDFRQVVDRDESDLNTLRLYGAMTLESFSMRQGELEKELSDNLARAFELAVSYAAEPKGWLAFNGAYGCGKTHLAAAIANARSRQGYPALFVVVPDLLDHLRAAFSPQSTVSYDKRFDEVRHAPLLVLDDLGTESATPWAQEKLFQLLNYRYVAALPTVITTAQEIKNLDPKLRTRLLDAGRCTLFVILAPAYRGGPAATKPRARTTQRRER